MTVDDSITLDLTSDSRLLGVLQDLMDELLDHVGGGSFGGCLPDALQKAQCALIANGGFADFDTGPITTSSCGDDALISALSGLVDHVELAGAYANDSISRHLLTARTLLGTEWEIVLPVHAMPRATNDMAPYSFAA